jgi:phenylpropionate dioxygenase-like ring-hydroxylating dioxygenase large terminal subunit
MTDLRAEPTAVTEAQARADAIGAVAPTVDGTWDRVGLPMPRNDALLDPATPRLRVRTVTDRFPFPLPNGWFIVAMSADLAPGKVTDLHLFDRDLVLFRTETGAPRLVDAYCPHLGAHLAVGGKVEGECVRCPFHGWAFDGASGDCVEIPYGPSERIPPKARVRPYPTIERGGAIWAWHHTEEGDPFFELPLVPEMEDAGWTAPLLREFWISTSCQEMAENNHDFAHFQYVHGTDSIPEGEEVIDGTYKSVKTPGLERETFGLGLGVVRVPGMLAFVSSVTPIDHDNVHVRWLFTVPTASGDAAATFFAEQFTAGVTQDIPIWENKIYRPLPVLTKSESGIIAHRNWSKQFYSGSVDL